MSSFSGISSALSALQAHRRTMDVVGQNIANVNTPGYTRQRAELQEVVSTSGVSLYAKSLPVGNGVTVSTISRAFDALGSARVNTQTADHALLSSRSQTLSNLEDLTGEPSDSGLAKQLNTMWATWSDAATKVGTTSADAAARNSVLGATQTVVGTLRAAYAGIEQQWSTTAAQTQAEVLEVNTAAADVAKLNELIQKNVATGGAANELMDQRDQLVTRVVELTGATTQAGPNGQVDLYVGGALLVQGSSAQKLTVTVPTSFGDVMAARATGASPAVVAAGTLTVTVGANTVTPTSGQLAASVEAMRTTLPQHADAYNAVADKLATEVNALQTQVGARDGNGKISTALDPTAKIFGGGPPYTAASITVAITDGRQIALGLDGRGATDGSNATAIAAIATKVGSPDAMWSGYVAKLGADASSATQRSSAVYDQLTATVSDLQGSSGVSLDEEGANLIAAQRAYQGAARVLTAVDEMLDTLINKTGLVGR